jgi:hypothetical protein
MMASVRIAAGLLVLVGGFTLGACGPEAGPTEAGPTEAGLTAAPASSTDATDVVEGFPAGVAAQVFGPWRAVPFPLPGLLIERLVASCRSQQVTFPAGVDLVVVDARGAGVAQLYFAGANGSLAACYDNRILPSGQIEAAGGGSTTTDTAPLPAMAPTGLQITDYSSTGDPPTRTYVSGRAGAGISAVQVVLPDGAIVQATLRGGWYAAWIPGELRFGWFVRGLNIAGGEVAKLPGI